MADGRSTARLRPRGKAVTPTPRNLLACARRRTAVLVSAHPRLDPATLRLVELELSAGELRILVSNHSPYEITGSRTDVTHAPIINLDASHPSSRHAVQVIEPTGSSRMCLLTAGGGASGIHEHSALVHDQRLVVAVGQRLCALRLPNLDLEWNVEVDDATCFGVWYSAKHDCYLSHGELAIARVTLDGTIVWSSGGKDIFSEGFALHDEYIEVVDFNREKYRIDLSTGSSTIVA